MHACPRSGMHTCVCTCANATHRHAAAHTSRPACMHKYTRSCIMDTHTHTYSHKYASNPNPAHDEARWTHLPCAQTLCDPPCCATAAAAAAPRGAATSGRQAWVVALPRGGCHARQARKMGRRAAAAVAGAAVAAAPQHEAAAARRLCSLGCRHAAAHVRRVVPRGFLFVAGHRVGRRVAALPRKRRIATAQPQQRHANAAAHAGAAGVAAGSQPPRASPRTANRWVAYVTGSRALRRPQLPPPPLPLPAPLPDPVAFERSRIQAGSAGNGWGCHDGQQAEARLAGGRC
eukprot:365297-Chlamydomonas_euryale.AAC.12